MKQNRIEAVMVIELPPCQAPSDSCSVNKSINEPTTSSASSLGNLPVSLPTL